MFRKKKGVEIGKELALDNETIRKLNTKKVVDAFDKVGNSMEEMRKNAKVSKIYLAIMLGLILFLVVGGLIAIAAKSGGISQFIDNNWAVENINKRIICETENQNMTFRTIEDAHYFKLTFNNESDCYIIDKVEG